MLNPTLGFCYSDRWLFIASFIELFVGFSELGIIHLHILQFIQNFLDKKLDLGACHVVVPLLVDHANQFPCERQFGVVGVAEELVQQIRR
jgi:hypothetical protein